MLLSEADCVVAVVALAMVPESCPEKVVAPTEVSPETAEGSPI